MRTTFIPLFAISFFFSIAQAQTIIYEENSRVIVEIESVPHTGWTKGSTTIGSNTITYLYATSEFLNTPGRNLLSYKIKINNPGTYRFVWHSKVGKGTSPTDHNDSWLRIPDAAAFYAKKDEASIIRPKGVCTNDCPNGTGSDGWFKVYSNSTLDWTFNRSWTSDHDPHAIYARFEEAGIYTVEISIRSDYHYLDRFVMFDETKHTLSQSTNLSLSPSSSEDKSSISGKVSEF
ncbi:MAG: hypothetical protein ACLFQA_04570 [Bacteroidales bacterium]